jgi:lambda family phage minor tail protein L
VGKQHRQARQASPDALVSLYSLDITKYGGPVLRWTPGPLGSASRNTIANHSLAQNGTGWTAQNLTAFGPANALGAAFVLADYGSGHLARSGAVTDAGRLISSGAFSATNNVAEAGQSWEAQVRVLPIRARARVDLTFLTAAGGVILSIPSTVVTNAGAPASARSLDDYTRIHARGVAPLGTARVRLDLVMLPLDGGSTDPRVVFALSQVARVTDPLALTPEDQLRLDDLAGTFQINRATGGVDTAHGGPMPWSEGRGVGKIAFGGITYEPFPLMIESISWTVRGAQPRPRVTVPDIDSQATALVVGYSELRGCPVERRQVFASNLDGGRDPDPSAFFGPERWFVDRLARHAPGEEVVLELVNALDLQGKMLPARQCIRDSCTHVYRRWNGSVFVGGTCPFNGTQNGNFMYKADGTATFNPAEDNCGRRVVDCDKRFPNGQPLPTRAFPGMSKYR